MKKVISVFLSCVLCLTLTVPVLAFNYEFNTGADTLSGFGKSTSNDAFVPVNPMNENTRRNKDAAFLPPPYGVFSGYIPTDPSSLYHSNLRGGHITAAPNLPHGGDGGLSHNNNIPFTPPPAPNVSDEGSTSIISQNTEPLFYADGSIGTIHVARTGRTVKVYAGESLDNMKKGAGHFTMTSAWDGNVGLCGHNRGSTAFFSFVKDMQIGDRITYTTRYGTRTYELFSKEQINEYDYSKLGWSAENLLTLITCVENAPELRWAAQLREVR
jgi:sortase A